jgi:uncharacterized membrane protein YcaP (DUF421 family)
MDLGRIAVRAIVAYVYLLFTTRVTGKRVVSQATPIDLMVSLIIGDLIDDALWGEVSMAKFGAAVATIVLAELLVKMAACRWMRVHAFVNGSPTVVLREGAADRRALRREQLNDGDLSHLLRLQGVEERGEVHIATVELDHQLSALRRPEAQPAQKQDAERLP